MNHTEIVKVLSNHSKEWNRFSLLGGERNTIKTVWGEYLWTVATDEKEEDRKAFTISYTSCGVEAFRAFTKLKDLIEHVEQKEKEQMNKKEEWDKLSTELEEKFENLAKVIENLASYIRLEKLKEESERLSTLIASLEEQRKK